MGQFLETNNVGGLILPACLPACLGASQRHLGGHCRRQAAGLPWPWSGLNSTLVMLLNCPAWFPRVQNIQAQCIKGKRVRV